MVNSKSLVSAVVLCMFSIVAYGQDHIKRYVRAHTVQISSIDPSSTEYSDFEPIGNAIGNASIVMLGEQDHGDAAAYLAKTKLIKYLHEKKGFDVLAFESDFFSLNEGWEQLKKERIEIDLFLKSNIYPIWSLCNACSTLLYHYIPSTYKGSRPLEITGFDSDLVLDYSSKNLIFRLDSVIRYLQLPIVKDGTYGNQIRPVLDSLKFGFSSILDTSFYKKSVVCLQAIKRQMEDKLPEDDFWMQVIDNLISSNINYQTRNTDIIRSFNARDSQMAQNLSWLSRVKYPGKKMIIWAANTHIAKSKDTLVLNKSGQGFTSMGAYFTRDSSRLKNCYILGFTSYSGKAGRLTESGFNIPIPLANHFEAWIDTAYQYAFIDFEIFNQAPSTINKPFYLKGFLHFPERENWTKLFDGIFYIKDMYSCEQ
jgi:erythromycin esterase